MEDSGAGAKLAFHFICPASVHQQNMHTLTHTHTHKTCKWQLAKGAAAASEGEGEAGLKQHDTCDMWLKRVEMSLLK